MNGLWNQIIGATDPADRVFQAVADFNRAINRPTQRVSNSRYGCMSDQERTQRNAKNKAARKARKQGRGKR